MLPFIINLKQGLPVSEQICFAARRAIVSGRMKTGDEFPSVRQISQELRINPNTAHKIISTLIHENLLIATPAVGTFVADLGPGSKQACAALLGTELEWIAVEAKKLGVSLAALQTALEKHWHSLTPPHAPSA
jgi:GntR family transcriptional regulator